MSQLPEGLSTLVGWTIAVYVLALFAISYWAQRRVQGVEDYVLAGRRLPLGLATATLLATWFGAGTLLAVADEVRAEGVIAAALDPLGAGVCLVLAGLFFARPLWERKLVTLPDFFGERFGPGVERISALLMVPVYFGWIAAQLVALAQMLELFFGVPPDIGLTLVAVVGVGYTLMGGMWAVTMTDALQMVLIIVGLCIVSYLALDHLGGGGVGAGLEALGDRTPENMRQWIPTENLAAFLGWLSVFCAGALGNLPSQDLMQRVFASKSASVAQRACLLAGLAYLVFGLLPVMLGLVGSAMGSSETSTLPMLASIMLHPAMAVVFVTMVLSAVLSTIDSAVLAPATVIARNIMRRTTDERVELRRHRGAVVFVGSVSLVTAYLGESAYSLLESGYELGLVSLLAPLVIGLYANKPSRPGIIASMVTGSTVWAAHFATEAEAFGWVASSVLPVGLGSMLLAFAVYPIAARLIR